MLKKFLVLLVLVIGSLPLWIWLTRAMPPRADSVSAPFLMPGEFAIKSAEFDWTRTAQSGERELATRVWYPVNAEGPLPIVVYSHGFMSTREGMEYLAKALAERGYLVAAPNFPNTYRYALKDPDAADVYNQPGDVSSVLDRLLANDQRHLPEVDPERVGLFGLSLGGLTTLLTVFMPEVSDARIDAAVSIAAPASMIPAEVFKSRRLPMLVIGGSLDRVIDFQTHTASLTDHIAPMTLVTIAGGSHIGFAEFAEPWMRWVGDPDAIACRAIVANLDDEPGTPTVCGKTYDEPRIHPGRQHMITQAAVTSFFASHFATDASTRAHAAQALSALTSDFPEATIYDSAR